MNNATSGDVTEGRKPRHLNTVSQHLPLIHVKLVEAGIISKDGVEPSGPGGAPEPSRIIRPVEKFPFERESHAECQPSRYQDPGGEPVSLAAV